MDEELLSNTISRYGLRELHVARMGAPVEAERWCELIPSYADGTAEMTRWVEDALGIHHLLIVWPAREVVHLVDGPSEWCGLDVVMWRLDKGQSLRDGAICAAVAYLERFGRWPTRAAVRKLPAGAQAFEVYRGESETAMVMPVEAGWVPVGYVVMFEEVSRE